MLGQQFEAEPSSGRCSPRSHILCTLIRWLERVTPNHNLNPFRSEMRRRSRSPQECVTTEGHRGCHNTASGALRDLSVLAIWAGSTIRCKLRFTPRFLCDLAAKLATTHGRGHMNKISEGIPIWRPTKGRGLATKWPQHVAVGASRWNPAIPPSQSPERGGRGQTVIRGPSPCSQRNGNVACPPGADAPG